MNPKKFNKQRKEVSKLLNNIDDEGLIEGLFSPCDYEGIKDKKFHKLRNKFLVIRGELLLKISDLKTQNLL